MKIRNNLLSRMKKTAALALLVVLANGCDSKVEGKITKKEVEPERKWIEQRTIAPMRCPPQTFEYLLTDREDFVFYVSRIDGKTDRFYTSKIDFEKYKLGENILYDPFLISTDDIIEGEEKIGRIK